jgi:L-lactate dehydrogenase complex protein LldE
MSEANPAISKNPPHGRRVGLLATCLIDTFRPNAGFAAVRLLEQAGFSVEVPVQGCCGQPNFNGGDEKGARQMAQAVINTFADFDYVVVPSSSCAAMIRVHYPGMFTAEGELAAAANALADKTWELTSFLVEVARVAALDVEMDATVVLHDSCSGLRELGVREQPRALLGQIRGLQLKEPANPEVCCGFGGTFCVKYPDISARIAENKIADLQAAGPCDALVSTDLGCLMHLGGALHRKGSTLQILHIAEVLAGMTGSEDTD